MRWLRTSGSLFPTLMAGKRQHTLISTLFFSWQSAPRRNPQHVKVMNRPTPVAASRNGHPPWEAIWVAFNPAFQLRSSAWNWPMTTAHEILVFRLTSGTCHQTFWCQHLHRHQRNTIISLRWKVQIASGAPQVGAKFTRLPVCHPWLRVRLLMLLVLPCYRLVHKLVFLRRFRLPAPFGYTSHPCTT